MNSPIKDLAMKVIEAGEGVRSKMYYIIDSGLSQELGETKQIITLAIRHTGGLPPDILGEHTKTLDLEYAQNLARACLVMLEKLMDIRDSRYRWSDECESVAADAIEQANKICAGRE